MSVDSRIALNGFPAGSCEPVRARVERTLEGLLARQGSSLSQLTTTISLPGSGGLLVECRIVAYGPNEDPIIVEESAETVQAALDGATERLARRLGEGVVHPQIRRRLRDIWRRRPGRNQSA